MVKETIELCDVCHKQGQKKLAEHRCFFCGYPLCGSHRKSLTLECDLTEESGNIYPHSFVKFDLDAYADEDLDKQIGFIYCEKCHEEVVKFMLRGNNFNELAKTLILQIKKGMSTIEI
jgi:hypothetical protein